MKSVKLISLVLFVYASIALAQTSTEKDLIVLENRFNEARVRADLKTIEGIEAGMIHALGCVRLPSC